MLLKPDERILRNLLERTGLFEEMRRDELPVVCSRADKLPGSITLQLHLLSGSLTWSPTQKIDHYNSIHDRKWNTIRKPPCFRHATSRASYWLSAYTATRAVMWAFVLGPVDSMVSWPWKGPELYMTECRIGK